MNKYRLVQLLNQYPDNMEIMILDGFNGGGCPREINSGPRMHVITPQEADESADCEDKDGYEVVVMGFGCY